MLLGDELASEMRKGVHRFYGIIIYGVKWCEIGGRCHFNAKFTYQSAFSWQPLVDTHDSIKEWQGMELVTAIR